MNKIKELLSNPLFYLGVGAWIIFIMICVLMDRQSDLHNEMNSKYWELKIEQWNLKKEISDG